MQSLFLSFMLVAGSGLAIFGGLWDHGIRQLLPFGQVRVAQTWPTDQPSCTAAGKYWCSSGMANSTAGTPSYYCTDTPCTQSECTAKSYKWCTDSQMTTGGWCMQSGTCPATDSATCTAQGSKWCTDSQSTHGGWCMQSGECPINTQSACTSAGRQWCPPSSGSTMGWCATSGTSCPNTTTNTTNTTMTCPSGQVQCPAIGTSPAGCYTTCPTASTGTNTNTTTTCPSGQVQCPAIGTSPAGCYTTCPTASTGTNTNTTNNTTTSPTDEASCKAANKYWCYAGTSPNLSWGCMTMPCNQTDCTAKNYKWCADPVMSSGGWCQQSGDCPSTSTTPTTCSSGQTLCPATNGGTAYCATTCAIWSSPTPESCKAQKQYYCPSSGGMGGGWCSPLPCTETECKALAKRWCPPAPMSNTMMGPPPTGWCTETSTTCPAYTVTDCAAQNGKWCKSQPGTMSGGVDGWCQTGVGSCPAYTSTDCSAQGGSWCQPSGGGMGWCASGPGATCPNEQKDKVDCAARAGQWCMPSGGGYGWCASGGTKCPANTAEECAARSGKWCKNSPAMMSNTVANMPAGWCSEGANSTCPAYTVEDCTAQGGSWCQPSVGGYPWCASGPGATCPSGSKLVSTTPQPLPVPEPKPLPKCPALPVFACRDNEEMFTNQNSDGCSISVCRPRVSKCLPTMAPACAPGTDASAYFDKDGCQKYECRQAKCSPPPADVQCSSGWIPTSRIAGACPVYECRTTDHSRTEDCVRTIVGDDLFAKMKKQGIAPSKEYMEKITSTCFVSNQPTLARLSDQTVSSQPIQCNLVQMKRDISTGVKRALQNVDTQVTRLRRQGVAIPASFQVLLTQLNSSIAAASSATTCDTLFEQGQTMPEMMRNLQDQLLDIERLGKANEFVKKFNKLILDAEKEWKLVSRNLKADVKADFEKNYVAATADFKSAIQEMVDAATSSDPDSIQLASEQSYDRYQQVRGIIDHVKIIRETNNILLKTKSEIRAAEKLATRLSKAGEDVADLTDAVTELKSVVVEVDANKTKCARQLSDDCLDLYERFVSTTSTFHEIQADFTGSSEFNKLFGLGGLGANLVDIKVLNQLEQASR